MMIILPILPICAIMQKFLIFFGSYWNSSSASLFMLTNRLVVDRLVSLLDSELTQLPIYRLLKDWFVDINNNPSINVINVEREYGGIIQAGVCRMFIVCVMTGGTNPCCYVSYPPTKQSSPQLTNQSATESIMVKAFFRRLINYCCCHNSSDSLQSGDWR